MGEMILDGCEETIMGYVLVVFEGYRHSLMIKSCGIGYLNTAFVEDFGCSSQGNNYTY